MRMTLRGGAASDVLLGGPGDDMRGRQLTLLDPFERLALLTGGGNDSVDSSGLAPEIVDLVVD